MLAGGSELNFDYFSCESQAGTHVILSQLGIRLEEISPVMLLEVTQHPFDRYPGSADNRLSGHDGWIN